jgi:hypothetical protein
MRIFDSRALSGILDLRGKRGRHNIGDIDEDEYL